jgi:Rrf2 family protein
MKIALGRKGDYAVRAVVDLARHADGGRRKSREVAEAMAIPATYLPQVLAALARAGIVTSVSGPDGGYALAVPPEAISLLDVVQAAEGSLESSECILRGGPCHWEGRCAVHEAWAVARDRFGEQLAATTLADILAEDARLEAASTAGPPPDGHPAPGRREAASGPSPR